MQVKFGGTLEEVVTGDEFSIDDARKIDGGQITTILGYGSQGPAQAQNLRDQGFNVIVGQREDYSKPNATKPTNWEKALDHGWEPGLTLFSDLGEAAARGDVVCMLIGDAGAPKVWPTVSKNLKEGDLLYFSHGMATNFAGIVPPKNVDVGMIAPKGAGVGVREMFLNGSGTNSSFALEQDFTGNLRNRILAMGFGIGSGNLFANTMKLEATEDHHGERNTLLASAGAVVEVSYKRARTTGMNPHDAFKYTSEQLTQVILPILGAEGAMGIYKRAEAAGKAHVVAGMQAVISAATVDINNELYKSCASGNEARIALAANDRPDYADQLERELKELNAKEVWKTGFDVRKEKERTYDGKIVNWELAGAMLGLIDSQYSCLLRNGHRKSASDNETVEELVQSLNPNYQKNGCSGLIGVCSTTAKRGSLDWLPKFETLLTKVWPVNPDGKVLPGYSSTDVWAVQETVMKLRP